MAQPIIEDFGDEDHEVDETGLTLDGINFGVSGEVWVFQNDSVSSPGLTDQLTVSGAWADGRIAGVVMDVVNNSPGAVFVFVKNDTEEWSPGYPFTLSAAGGGGTDVAALGRYRHRLDLSIGL